MKCIVCGGLVSYGDCGDRESPGYPSEEYGRAMYAEHGPVHHVCDLKRALTQLRERAQAYLDAVAEYDNVHCPGSAYDGAVNVERERLNLKAQLALRG